MAISLEGPGTILAICEEEEFIPPSKDGLFSATSRMIKKVVSLNTAEISVNLQEFCEEIGSITKGLVGTLHGYQLESLELSVDISASGEVRFIASVSSEIKGGVRLLFKRSPTVPFTPEEK